MLREITRAFQCNYVFFPFGLTTLQDSFTHFEQNWRGMPHVGQKFKGLYGTLCCGGGGGGEWKMSPRTQISKCSANPAAVLGIYTRVDEWCNFVMQNARYALVISTMTNNYRDYSSLKIWREKKSNLAEIWEKSQSNERFSFNVYFFPIMVRIFLPLHRSFSVRFSAKNEQISHNLPPKLSL